MARVFVSLVRGHFSVAPRVHIHTSVPFALAVLYALDRYCRGTPRARARISV